jgi:hypothetical protein
MDLTWLKSFKTIKFNTTSGWLEDGQYALTEGGDAYWVIKPGFKGGIPGRGITKVPLDTDIKGLTEVQIIGETSYNEFDLGDGKIYQEESPVAEYAKLAIKDSPMPTKTMTQKEVTDYKRQEGTVTKP